MFKRLKGQNGKLASPYMIPTNSFECFCVGWIHSSGLCAHSESAVVWHARVWFLGHFVDVSPPSNALFGIKVFESSSDGRSCFQRGFRRKGWVSFCMGVLSYTSFKIIFMEAMFFSDSFAIFFFSPPLWTASYNMCAGLHFHIIELKPFPLQGRIWLSWKSSLTGATLVQIQLQLLPQQQPARTCLRGYLS